MGQTRQWQRWIQLTLWCLVALTPLGMSGCFLFSPGMYAPETVAQTPPMTWQDANGVFELTMQAPNPGWRVEYDGSRTTREGVRLLFTIRRPDPGMLYPSRVVEKTLRTDHPVEDGGRVWARVLGHTETRGKYSPSTLEIDSLSEP